jgi:hypothetical protein
MPPRKRKGFRVNAWKATDVPYAPPTAAAAAQMVVTIEEPRRYHALEDCLFPGTWKVEPVDYVGRGIVYLFKTEAEARDWAKHKNQKFAGLKK